jgi:hypothetical protein
VVHPVSDQDVQELRQQFADDTAEWRDIRDEGSKDMRYVSGDPWAEHERAAREKAGRPCLSLDELSQYTNQGVNKLRANKRAVKFAPIGDGASEQTAEFYADLMRDIEYRSQAQTAYITAAENMFQRSYGFCRVNVRYASAYSVNQDIWIDPIHNPDLVTPDPYALMPNMSDMKGCWISEPWPIEAFNARWPKQKIEGRQTNSAIEEAPTWVSPNQVWVRERWKIRTKPRTLLIVEPAVDPMMGGQPPAPIGVFKDEYTPEMGRVSSTREVEDPAVYQCLTNGLEILEENPWKGKYIPIIAAVGKVLYVDGKRQIMSLIRLARDPYMLYCYYRTCEAELVGMTPKFPYFVYEGQLDPQQLLNLQKSLHEPIAVIEVKSKIEGSMADPLPYPQRQPYEPPIQALEVGAESARRAIQSAVGQSPLPTQAQRRNEKSGVALKHIDEAIEIGSYHFTDHYEDMIRHVGVVVEDLLPHIYDTARDVGVRKPNDTSEIVRINEPGGLSTRGAHLVTISTGPSFESEREATKEFIESVVASPEMLAVAGPNAPKVVAQAIKMRNLGEGGDQLAQLYDPSLKPGGESNPQQMAAENAQLKAQLEQTTQAAQQMQQELETDAAKQKATIAKAQIDAETTLKTAQMAEMTKLKIAELANVSKPQQEAEAEAIEADLQRQFDLLLAEIEHKHAMELERLKGEQAEAAAIRQSQQADIDGEQEHAYEAESAERDHGHALEQGEQSHQHSLEAGDQQVKGKIAVEKSKPKPKPAGKK